jgi:SAM-dependent methyltransferase
VTAMDPKAVAQERFAEPDVKATDLIGQRATDVPLVVRGLVDAVRERVGAGGRVCELGFGAGWLLEELRDQLPNVRLYGLDLSPGQTQRAQKLYGDRVRFVVGDMEQLPFRDRSLDVIVACWTLYFMRDIDVALAEIKRCLRTGGRLIAAASAPEHEVEANDIVADAVRHALGRELSAEELDVGRRFDLETGTTYVRRHFPQVELREWRGEMALSASEVASMWRKWEPALLSKREQDATHAAFLRLVPERLGSGGVLRIQRREGAFVCDLM